MILFEFLLLTGTLLTVGIALRRLRQAEREVEALRRQLDRRSGSHREAEELAAMGALTGEFCQMIISPLTVILAQCELARSQETADRRLASIEKQARRIASVVERHRGACSRDQAATETLDPLAVARAALESVSECAQERDIRVHEMLDEEVPSIRANPFLLAHALRHLLRAGIDAAPKGMGDVTLAVGCLPPRGEPTHLAFAVADDGPGIDPVQLPRVFHPFPDQGGSWRSAGFSYAIVYAIARAMGSNLVIETAPGAGTRATMKIPLPKKAEPKAGVEVLQSRGHEL